jgi:hypothetical protein
MKKVIALFPLLLAGCYVYDRHPHGAVVVQPAHVSGPVVVEEYYWWDNHYWYWHPGYARYEIWVGVPLAGYRVQRLGRLPPRAEVVRMHQAERFVPPQGPGRADPPGQQGNPGPKGDAPGHKGNPGHKEGAKEHGGGRGR